MNCLKNVCLVCLLLLCTMFLGVQDAAANPSVVLHDGSTSITATVSEESEFTITPKGEGNPNCINDYTSWSFDFAGIDFLTPIDQAQLTLQVLPKAEKFDNDRVQIEGLGWIGGIAPDSFAINVEESISLDLLQNYSSVDILSAFTSDHQLPLRFEDDACVKSATLKLVVTCSDR